MNHLVPIVEPCAPSRKFFGHGEKLFFEVAHDLFREVIAQYPQQEALGKPGWLWFC